MRTSFFSCRFHFFFYSLLLTVSIILLLGLLVETTQVKTKQKGSNDPTRNLGGVVSKLSQVAKATQGLRQKFSDSSGLNYKGSGSKTKNRDRDRDRHRHRDRNRDRDRHRGGGGGRGRKRYNQKPAIFGAVHLPPIRSNQIQTEILLTNYSIFQLRRLTNRRRPEDDDDSSDSGDSSDLDDEEEDDYKWTDIMNCRPGAAVTGFKLSVVHLPSETLRPPAQLPDEVINNHVYRPDPDGDAAGVEGMALQCSTLDMQNYFKEDSVVHFGKNVDLTFPWKLASKVNPAVGFEFLRWTNATTGKPMIGRWRLKFQREKKFLHNFPTDSIKESRRRESVECPGRTIVSGFQAQYNTKLGILTRIRLTCVQFCYPQEVQMTIYDFSNWGRTEVSHAISKKLGVRTSNSNVGLENNNTMKHVQPAHYKSVLRNDLLHRPNAGATSVLKERVTDGLYTRFASLLDRFFPSLLSPTTPSTSESGAATVSVIIPSAGPTVITTTITVRHPAPSSLANVNSSDPAQKIRLDPGPGPDPDHDLEGHDPISLFLTPSEPGNGGGHHHDYDHEHGHDKVKDHDHRVGTPSVPLGTKKVIQSMFDSPFKQFSWKKINEMLRKGRNHVINPTTTSSMTSGSSTVLTSFDQEELPPVELPRPTKTFAKSRLQMVGTSHNIHPRRGHLSRGRRQTGGQTGSDLPDHYRYTDHDHGLEHILGGGQGINPFNGVLGLTDGVHIPVGGIPVVDGSDTYNQNNNNVGVLPYYDTSYGGPSNLREGGGGGGGGGEGPARYHQDATNLMAAFEAKYGKQKTNGFTWSDATWQYTINDHDEQEHIICKAHHRCIVKQLVGVCLGQPDFQFDTPSFTYLQIPLLPANGFKLLPKPEPPFDPEVVIPGEIWVTLQNLTFAERSKEWTNSKVCPPGAIVTAQQIKSLPRVPISGLTLQCSRFNSSDMYQPVGTISTGSGDSKLPFSPSREAVGATMVELLLNGRRRRMNFEFRFAGSEEDLPIPRGATEIDRRSAMCPTKYAVCGMRAMYDQQGTGLMTDLALKCCYSCNPQEKVVVLESFTNLGYTDTLQTIRKTTGTQFNNAKTGEARNATADIVHRHGVNLVGLQAGFGLKFDMASAYGFNWRQTAHAMWTRNEEKTQTITCKARHSCTFRQLVGVCGDIEIPTPYTMKESIWLDDPLGNGPSGPIPVEEMGTKYKTLPPSRRPGETWILATNLTGTSNTSGGSWEPAMLCPLGTVVTSQQLKLDPGSRLISGLNVVCGATLLSSRGDKFRFVKELSGGEGVAQKLVMSQTPAVGLSFIEQFKTNSTTGKVQKKVRWEVKFTRESPTNFGNTVRRDMVCPGEDQAVCGFQAKYFFAQEENANFSEGILTDLALKCCYHCQPTEKMVVLDLYQNSGYTDTVQRVRLKVGAGVKNILTDPEDEEAAANGGVNTMLDAIESTSRFLQQTFALAVKPGENRASRSISTGTTPKNATFDWTQTTLSFWKEMTTKPLPIICRARNSCMVSQLIGQCGVWEVYTPYTMKEGHDMDHVDPPSKLQKKGGSSSRSQPTTLKLQQSSPKMTINNSMTFMPRFGVGEVMTRKSPTRPKSSRLVTAPKLTKMTMPDRPGESWIIAGALVDPNLGHRSSGDWSNPAVCPADSFVTAYKIVSSGSRQNPNRGSSINVACSKFTLDGIKPAKVLAINTHEKDPAPFTNSMTDWRKGSSHAVGFSMGENFGLDLTFADDPGKNQSHSQVKCPIDHSICGVRTMLADYGRGTLTHIGFKCCPHVCTPQEKMVVLDWFENMGGKNTSYEVKLAVGFNNSESEVDREVGSTLKSIFSRATFPRDHEHPWNFDWRHTWKSLWWGVQIKPLTVMCKARRLCKFEQLIGICIRSNGRSWTVRTPYTVLESQAVDTGESPDDLLQLDKEKRQDPDQSPERDWITDFSRPPSFPASSSSTRRKSIEIPAKVSFDLPPRKFNYAPPQKLYEIPSQKSHELPRQKSHEIPRQKNYELPPKTFHTIPPRKSHDNYQAKDARRTSPPKKSHDYPTRMFNTVPPKKSHGFSARDSFPAAPKKSHYYEPRESNEFPRRKSPDFSPEESHSYRSGGGQSIPRKKQHDYSARDYHTTPPKKSHLYSARDSQLIPPKKSHSSFSPRTSPDFRPAESQEFSRKKSHDFPPPEESREFLPKKSHNFPPDESHEFRPQKSLNYPPADESRELSPKKPYKFSPPEESREYLAKKPHKFSPPEESREYLAKKSHNYPPADESREFLPKKSHRFSPADESREFSPQTSHKFPLEESREFSPKKPHNYPPADESHEVSPKKSHKFSPPEASREFAPKKTHDYPSKKSHFPPHRESSESTSIESRAIEHTKARQLEDDPISPPIQPHLGIDRLDSGEIWIKATNISFSTLRYPRNNLPAVSSSVEESKEKILDWSHPSLCPPGSFVSSAVLYKTLNPTTSLKGIHLGCFQFRRESPEFVKQLFFSSGSEEDGQQVKGLLKRNVNSSPAIGFTFVEYQDDRDWKEGKGKNTPLLGFWELRYQGKNKFLRLPDKTRVVKRHQILCPPSSAVCGVQTLFGGDDDGVLTGLRFKCCFHCTPVEKLVVLNSFVNMDSMESTQAVRWMVGVSNPSRVASLASAAQFLAPFQLTPPTEKELFSTPLLADPIQLSKLFGAGLGQSSLYFGFDWAATSRHLWTTVEERTDSYKCQPRHFCSYKQLVGSCEEDSDFYISMPLTLKQSVPIPSSGQSSSISSSSSSGGGGRGSTTNVLENFYYRGI